MRRGFLLCLPLLISCSLVTSIGPASPTSPPVPTPVPTPAVTAAATQPVATEPTPGASIPSAFPDPAGFGWDRVADGFSSPVDLQPGGDGRLYVVEQAGIIRAVSENGAESAVVLDIRGRVGSSGNEQGLLGLAFHPEDASLFVNYTDRRGNTVIARYRREGGAVDPDSEQIVLTYDQPFPNHNGGGLAFGPDGMLYIGSGDGGAAGDPQGRAQNLDSLLGKILRLDVDGEQPYRIPADNPFAASGGRAEIWAYGLRNPWRLTFDPQTGDLFIGDVGQNQWEEIDHLPGGAPGGSNFGWDYREGLEPYEGQPPAGLTDPVAVYSHTDGCSVTGGLVVRDPALPEWNGIYLYGDYCSGLVWGLFQDAQGVWQNRLVFETGMRITSFGSDDARRTYLVDREGGIYRLERR